MDYKSDTLLSNLTKETIMLCEYAYFVLQDYIDRVKYMRPELNEAVVESIA